MQDVMQMPMVSPLMVGARAPDGANRLEAFVRSISRCPRWWRRWAGWSCVRWRRVADAVEPLADRAADEHRSDGAVDAAREPHHDLPAAAAERYLAAPAPATTCPTPAR